MLGCGANLITTDNIPAAIAHLNEIEAITLNRSSSKGSTHARASRIFLAANMDCEVSVNRGILQALDQIDSRIARVFSSVTDEHFAHRVNGHPAGNVPRKRATHAI